MLTVRLRSIQLNSFTAIYSHAYMSLSQNMALFIKPAGKNKPRPRVTTLWCRQLSQEFLRFTLFPRILGNHFALVNRGDRSKEIKFTASVGSKFRGFAKWSLNGDYRCSSFSAQNVWWKVYSTTVSIVSSSLFVFVKILPSAQVEFFNQLI